ncbi:hypothetical protein BGZ60DRAFT_235618 [Tricladium varicosporioides]|nr:hypothetical protein BGZ60DRAFT_235618 [Hymenoscyphus varicosporioides]
MPQRTIVRDDRYDPSLRATSVDRGSPYRAPVSDVQQSSDMANTRHRYESFAPGESGESRNEKILGAISVAALVVGGKELWDRRGGEVHHLRSDNALSTAAISAAGAFAGYKADELYTKHTDKAGGRVDPHIGYQGRNGRVLERNGRNRSLPRPGTGWREAVGAPEVQHAAKAALLAGVTEAFRIRKEPGGWDGPKGRRVLTVTAGAGAIDTAADHNTHKHPKRHVLEAIVGGLAANRVVNGPRNNIKREWRRKSRSRSRGLSDSESYSSESYDSRSPSPSRGGRHNRHKHSKSFTGYACKGPAAIGAG